MKLKYFIATNFFVGSVIFLSCLVSPNKVEYIRAEEASISPPIAIKAPPRIVKHKVVHYIKPEITPETKACIDDIFGDEAEIATAVLMHESGLRLDAINWNCRYEGKSKSCKIEDRHLAWSVDCGIGQTNVKGKVCPAKLLTLDGNMEQIEKIYKSQGLSAWVSYTSGAYKKFL